MNIRMSATHVKTLCKLKELAEKHDCEIRVGMNSRNQVDTVDWDLIKKHTGSSDDVIDELQDVLFTDGSIYQFEEYWFELYDKVKKTHNILSYIEEQTSFCYQVDDEDDLSEAAHEWIELNIEYTGSYGCGRIYDNIYGFEGIDTSFVNVYREGMLLKFFGDLVCDYLGEERIHEVY